jgi:hypothetical protein
LAAPNYVLKDGLISEVECFSLDSQYRKTGRGELERNGLKCDRTTPCLKNTIRDSEAPKKAACYPENERDDFWDNILYNNN